MADERADNVIVEVEEAAASPNVLADILREVVTIRELLQTPAAPSAKQLRKSLKVEYSSGKTLESLGTHYGKTVNEVATILKLKLPTIRVERKGTPWTDRETDELMDELRSKTSWSDIAYKHGRSEIGVKLRLGQYLGWRTRQGDSLDALAELTGQTVDDVQGLIDEANLRRDHRMNPESRDSIRRPNTGRK